MSVQHKKNFTKLDNQDHILVKKGLAAVARRFLETRKVRLRDGKVLFLCVRILFFSKNATYFVIEPELAEAFNYFFSSMVDNLKIEYDINRQTNLSTHPDPLLRTIETSNITLVY